jgi:diguanylate cyclase (GGDEF)-like protein
VSQFDSVRYFAGDFRRLTTLIGTAIGFFGAILLAIIAYTGWTANETATEIERALIQNAVDQSIARTLNEQKSVAWWDDSVTKITDEAIDLDFVDSNFGVFLTETYTHDEVYILNRENRPLYAFLNGERGEPSSFEQRRHEIAPILAEVRDGQGSRLSARPDKFSELQGGYRLLAGAVQAARWAGHIISVDGRPAVVAALTIVPNVDMTLLRDSPNLLISITYVDDEFVSEIGRSLLLDDLTLLPERAAKAGLVSEPFMGDDGNLGGYLTWSTRRPGHALLAIILPLVAIGIVATGLLSRVMLRRLRRTSERLAYSELQARHESRHDALSGLPNRAHMVDRINAFLQSCGPAPLRHGAVAAYVDIDRFKDVNDTLGHEAGDHLIRAAAYRLRESLRPNDFIARFGGDEFVILCAPADADAVPALAERIANAFQAPFAVNGQNIRVTASIGIALAPEHGLTADTLMRHADIALYRAKERGRDCSVVFCDEMAQQVEIRRAIELALRTALEEDTLTLHYQPLISSRSGEIVGLEALLRWQHPAFGDVSPGVFIPIAENAGILPSLGEWVLTRAMHDSRRWPHLEISVNLSPVQFRHVDLKGTLHRLVSEYGIEPSRFVLEITEGVLLETTEHTNSILKELRSIGFKTALDDFGTGYSSLAYLCDFKFDKIKIDRSFVSRLAKIDIAGTIVQSIVSIGRGLGMEIVAEGVETEFEAQTMARLGCTELQGYYFSKPLDADQTIAFLRSFQPEPLSQFPRPIQIVAASGGAQNRPGNA